MCSHQSQKKFYCPVEKKYVCELCEDDHQLIKPAFIKHFVKQAYTIQKEKDLNKEKSSIELSLSNRYQNLINALTQAKDASLLRLSEIESSYNPEKLLNELKTSMKSKNLKEEQYPDILTLNKSSQVVGIISTVGEKYKKQEWVIDENMKRMNDAESLHTAIGCIKKTFI